MLGIDTPIAYYQAAITYVKMFYPDAHFYFFSDDINYAKEQFGPCKNYHYVHLLGGMDADLEEFFCISACNGRVLARQSGFSAWATVLSQSQNQINLCPEDENRAWEGNGQIYLNQTAINTLSRQYVVAKQTSIPSPTVNNEVYRLLTEDQNDEVIARIDQASLDSYYLSEADTAELTTFKAIALAQKGAGRLPEALRIFYRQMQTEHENPVFHANYFRALYQSGHVAESAIHAALANRFGDAEDYRDYFADPLAQKLYRLLRDRPIRHFIFIPMESWNYYITYGKTLAALLARMGQKVTFFQPTDAAVEGNISNSFIAEQALQEMVTADGVYCYHVDLVPNPIIRDRFLLQELTRQCAARFDMPAVVVASNPNVFHGPRVDGIKYAAPDIYDPLNREHFFLESNHISEENYVTYMAERMDAVFLSGNLLEEAKKRFGDKIHAAFPAWEGPAYQILNMELDFTPNYIASEQMLRNAAALLEL